MTAAKSSRILTRWILPAVVAVTLTAGCVPGQPYRAADTAEAYLKAYVGASDVDPKKYACPGVSLTKRDPAAPNATIAVSEASNNPNGTMTVQGTVTVDGEETTMAITLRTDGKCILNIKN